MNDQHEVGGGVDAGSEPTVETSPVQQPARSPAAAALLNLTGLALGYAYLRSWWRFGLYLTGAVVLVLVAFLTEAAGTPWAWQAIAALWLGWTAVDAWLLARRGPRLHGARPQLVPVGVGVVLVAAVVGGYLAYLAAGSRSYAAGVAAQARGDCTPASAEFALVTGVYELTLSPDVQAADVRLAQCDEFRTAAAERGAGAYDAAVARYRQFREAYPDTELVPFVTSELYSTFTEWVQARRTAGDPGAAIGIYRDALTEPAVLPLVRTELAATYLERAAEARTAAPDLTSVQAAVNDLLTVTREFGDTPAAAQVPQAFTDTYTAATPAVAEQRWCDALPVVNYFVTLPDAETAGVVGRAHADRARSQFECGLANFRSADFTGAIDHLDRFAADYPNDPGVALARSAVIAARVGNAKLGPPPPLPAPLGDNSPGSIPVVIHNDSPNTAQVLVAGPTAHIVDVPPCPTCTPFYANAADGCPSVSGKPSVTLRLAPGTYDLLLTFPGAGGQDRVETRTYQPGWEYSECSFQYRTF